jgi:hypothetical protein
MQVGCSPHGGDDFRQAADHIQSKVSRRANGLGNAVIQAVLGYLQRVVARWLWVSRLATSKVLVLTPMFIKFPFALQVYACPLALVSRYSLS